MKNSFERFVETPLFLIAAVQGNRFDGFVRLQQAFCGEFDPPMDDVGMNGGLYQFVKSELEFFAIDGKAATETEDTMLFVYVRVDKFSDLHNQLSIFSFHIQDRFNGYSQP